MDEARAQTSGSELSLPPHRIQSEPAATSGIRPGFDAKKMWQTANKKVLMVHRTHKKVLSVKEKFRRGPAFYQIVLSNFRKAAVTRPELYLEASFEVFLSCPFSASMAV